MSFDISTPNDVAKQIAARVKARRLELNLTQEGMAARAGLKFAYPNLTLFLRKSNINPWMMY